MYKPLSPFCFTSLTSYSPHDKQLMGSIDLYLAAAILKDIEFFSCGDCWIGGSCNVNCSRTAYILSSSCLIAYDKFSKKLYHKIFSHLLLLLTSMMLVSDFVFSIVIFIGLRVSSVRQRKKSENSSLSTFWSINYINRSYLSTYSRAFTFVCKTAVSE